MAIMEPTGQGPEAEVVRACEECGTPMPGARKNKRFCGSACVRRRSAAVYAKNNPRPAPGDVPIPSGTIGAMHELVVAADLLGRGFSVFRALSPSCPCDLAVLKGDRLLRIEVRTGSYLATGKLGWRRGEHDACDLYAVVVKTEAGPPVIFYDPPLPVLPQ